MLPLGVAATAACRHAQTAAPTVVPEPQVYLVRELDSPAGLGCELSGPRDASRRPQLASLVNVIAFGCEQTHATVIQLRADDGASVHGYALDHAECHMIVDMRAARGEFYIFGTRNSMHGCMRKEHGVWLIDFVASQH